MNQARQVFNNKKVLIMGLGTKGGGTESARFAYKNGAQITISDLQSEESLSESLKEIDDIPKRLILGEHLMHDYRNHDIIIKNPGIQYNNPFIKEALSHGKIIETPIGLFSKFNDKPYIGITGTKGKSFTTELVSHILSVFNIDSIAAGNNCISPLPFLGSNKHFVLELSSWQLRELGLRMKSPNIACWLNFFPDHLNHYSSVDEYFTDKKCILDNQGSDNFCVLPYGYTKLRNLQTKARKFLFSVENISDRNISDSESICYVKNNEIWIEEGNLKLSLLNLNELDIDIVPHQLELILASVCITYIYIKYYNFSGYSKELLSKALNSFGGLEHRFEIVHKKSKLLIINDSAASTPESAILALRAVKKLPVVLIAGGGAHKNLSFSNLASEIKLKKAFVLLYENDETSAKIEEELCTQFYSDYLYLKDLQAAVRFAATKLKNMEGTILLSPACSGAPMFRDMFERGRLFKKFIKDLNIDNQAI